MGNPSWVKGQSANPSGRPSGSRSIADSLRTVGKEKIKYKGHYTTKENVLAHMMYEGLVTFRAVSPDDKVLSLSPKLWLDLAKFVSVHMDGTAPTNVDITSGGMPIKTYIGFSPSEWDDIIDAEVIDNEQKQLSSGKD